MTYITMINSQSTLRTAIESMAWKVHHLEVDQENTRRFYAEDSPQVRHINSLVTEAENKWALLGSLAPGENGRSNLDLPCVDVLNAKIDFYMQTYLRTSRLLENRPAMQACVDLRNSITGRLREGMTATPADYSGIPTARRPSFSSADLPSNSRYNSSKTFEEISPQNHNLNPFKEYEDLSPFKGEPGDYSPFKGEDLNMSVVEEYQNLSEVEEYLNMSVEDYLNMSVGELAAHLCNLVSALPRPIVGLFMCIALGLIYIIIKLLVIIIKYKKLNRK